MASQPSQTESSIRSETPGRDAGAIRVRRHRWLRPAVIGLALGAVALGAWGLRAILGENPSPDALWEQAEAHLRVDRIDLAAQAVNRLGRLREPTSEDRLLRGQLAVALGRPDEAIAELSLVPDDHPMASRARLLAGQVELRRERFRYAEEALRAAVRLDPTLVQAHRELIFIYGFQLRRAELAGEFLALSRVTDLSFEEMFHWGLLRNEFWEPSGAAETLARCVAADPDDRCSRLALSDDQRRMSILDEAESTLAGMAPDDPEVIAAHVRIALDRSDVPRAEQLLASGPPDDPVLARLRGRVALARRDGKAAARYFRIAYDAQPESYEALSGLIAAVTTQGDVKSAQPLREIAAKWDRLQSLISRISSKEGRKDPEMPILLGDAYADLHHDAEARGWYKVAIARDPLDSRAQRGLFRLGAAAAPKIK